MDIHVLKLISLVSPILAIIIPILIFDLNLGYISIYVKLKPSI